MEEVARARRTWGGRFDYKIAHFPFESSSIGALYASAEWRHRYSDKGSKPSENEFCNSSVKLLRSQGHSQMVSAVYEMG